MTTICHFSSAHSGLDTRIYRKECVSLARRGYETHLVIAGSEADQREAQNDGVILHRLPDAPASRVLRAILRFWQCLTIVRKIKPRICHFHDVELIPVGILLRLTGARVIYDVHEDVPVDIGTKEWIPLWLRMPVAGMVRLVENLSTRFFLTPVCATPFIAKRYSRYNRNTVCVNNYPILGELSTGPVDWSVKESWVSYVGGITRIRGIADLVQAMEKTTTGARLQLCGEFSEPDLLKECQELPGWSKTDHLGFLGRSEVAEVLKKSVAGLVTFYPYPNHTDAQPNKMFEYMSAGIPVIGSHFTLWKDIIEGSQCGICVDPENPKEIAQAIDYLVENPRVAEDMGMKGKKAVNEIYNWSREEEKLADLYRQLEK